MGWRKATAKQGPLRPQAATRRRRHGCPLRPSLRLHPPRPGLPLNRGLSLTRTRSQWRHVASRALRYSD